MDTTFSQEVYITICSTAQNESYLYSSSQCGTQCHNVSSPPMTVLSNHLSFTHSQTHVKIQYENNIRLETSTKEQKEPSSWTPPCESSVGMVLLHVVFGRPLLRFPVGVHLRATFEIESCGIRRTWPNHLNLCFYIWVLIGDEFVLLYRSSSPAWTSI